MGRIRTKISDGTNIFWVELGQKSAMGQIFFGSNLAKKLARGQSFFGLKNANFRQMFQYSHPFLKTNLTKIFRKRAILLRVSGHNDVSVDTMACQWVQGRVDGHKGVLVDTRTC